MKNIKQMLKKMSDEQEIHDIQDNILKNVDMNKVRHETYVKPVHPRRFILISNIASAFAAAMLVVLIVLIIRSNDNNEKPFGNENTVENGNNNSEFESNYMVFNQYLQKMVKQEAYNIINIVPTIGNISHREVTLNTESKAMTDSEMDEIVDDLNSQIYNVEEMLGITSILCESGVNPYYGVNGNQFSNYENKISVSGPLNPYHLYFTEIGKEDKNIGMSNFKSKSKIEGLIDTGSDTYSFTGNKEYKNSKTTYSTIVNSGEYMISVKEVFGTDSNEFTYAFTKNDVAFKSIYIEQKFDDDGNVRALAFKNQYTSLNVEKKTVTSDSIVFKIDSRNSDTLTVTKTNTGYKYKFKNSGKEYTK